MNTGIIAAHGESRPRKEAARRTFIVTGIASGGTSLLAAVLHKAGVFMGEFVDGVSHDDGQILQLLRQRDMPLLQELIRARNTRHPLWGCKLPNLHTRLRHDELALFRNPHLLVMCRDPAAVAARHALSGQHDQLDALVQSANAMHALARFVRQANCPVLLLSYEKALALPNLMIDSVLRFCGIELDETARIRLLLNVQPNRPEFHAAASSAFEGRIDGVLDGQLYGWCCQSGRLEPVKLDIFADEQRIDSVLADAFREDLAHAGLGNGCHGFFVDLSRHTLRRNATIRVKISNRVLELENSGQPLGRLREAVGHA